ncbi:MAG TPA: hypothetical protein DCE14_08010 [Kosmotogaceae bacterium]|nr:MAG: Uncharacterized protein XE05_1143 [Thermotogales bacterium 46_20]HAA86271.1 hypothetical protein [Kosmotogaceae bacterium]
MDNEELVRRIVEEKGSEAIPQLLELIDSEDDEVATICLEAVLRIGETGRDSLLGEISRRVRVGKRNDLTALYILDKLAEVGEQRAVEQALTMLSLYDDERALLVIYESLARLGHCDKVIAVLEAMIDEPMDDEMRQQVISTLAFCGTKKAVELLVNIYDDPVMSRSTKAFVLEAFVSILSSFPHLVTYLERETASGKEIIERVNRWLDEKR